MKTVNLLPAWYVQKARQQKTLRVHIGVMVLMAAAMAGATWAGNRQVAAVNQERTLVARKLATVPNDEDQLKQQQADLKRFEELRLARRELGNTVPMSAVIQQLQNDMTPGMALSNVAVEVRSEPVKGSGFVGDTRNPPKYRDVAHLNVVGIAPNDRQVAQLIDSISQNPLFSDVTLDYTRTGMLHNYPVRKFEIQISMDLERLTTQVVDAPAPPPAPAEAESVAPLASGGPVHGQ